MQYVIRENGEKGRKIPAAANPTYEDLQKAIARQRDSRRILMTVWAVIFALALGGLIWLRLRRRKHNPQQS
jgi:multidrug resistance efflux pump